MALQGALEPQGPAEQSQLSQGTGCVPWPLEAGGPRGNWQKAVPAEGLGCELSGADSPRSCRVSAWVLEGLRGGTWWCCQGEPPLQLSARAGCHAKHARSLWGEHYGHVTRSPWLNERPKAQTLSGEGSGDSRGHLAGPGRTGSLPPLPPPPAQLVLRQIPATEVKASASCKLNTLWPQRSSCPTETPTCYQRRAGPESWIWKTR